MPDILRADTPAGSSQRPSGAIELAGDSAAVGRTRALLERAAVLDSGVLIVAERGIEVESVARDLHAGRRGPAAPLIAVGCADDAAVGRSRAVWRAGHAPGDRSRGRFT